MHNKVASCIMHVCMYAAEHWLIQLSPTLALWQSNGHLPCNSRCNSNINIGQRLCIYGALHHWTHCKQQWKETSRQTEALVKTLLLMVYECDRIKSMLMKLWRKRSARVYCIMLTNYDAFKAHPKMINNTTIYPNWNGISMPHILYPQHLQKNNHHWIATQMDKTVVLLGCLRGRGAAFHLAANSVEDTTDFLLRVSDAKTIHTPTPTHYP